MGDDILNNFYHWNFWLKCIPTRQEIKEILGKCTDFQSSVTFWNPKDFFNFCLYFIFFEVLQTSKQSWSLYRLIFLIFCLTLQENGLFCKYDMLNCKMKICVDISNLKDFFNPTVTLRIPPPPFSPISRKSKAGGYP